MIAATESQWPGAATAALATGFLGAFTMFSTRMYETVHLLEASAWRAAVINIIGPLLIGPLLVLASVFIAGQMFEELT